MWPVSDVSGGIRLPTVLGLAALTDLVAGLVLAAVGLVTESQVLALVGVVLLLSGGGLLAYVIRIRNRPEAL